VISYRLAFPDVRPVLVVVFRKSLFGIGTSFKYIGESAKEKLFLSQLANRLANYQ
jgi:hypothetical protein